MSTRNICFRRGASNRYILYMFSWRDKKIFLRIFKVLSAMMLKEYLLSGCHQ